MQGLSFTVPGAPRAKERPRFSRATGRAYTPAQTVRYENLVKHSAAVAMGQRGLIEGPITLSMVAYLTVPASWARKRRAAALCGLEMPTGRPDWENYAKVVDALNGVVWIDDSQVVDGRLRKLYANTPRMEIVVTPYFSA